MRIIAKSLISESLDKSGLKDKCRDAKWGALPHQRTNKTKYNMPTINKRVIAKQVPLFDRTFIVGDDELMGYLGVESTSTLKKSYIERGLQPTSQIGRTKYYRKSDVDKFIIEHNEWQQVKVK